MKPLISLLPIILVFCAANIASAKDYYVSANRGKGRRGTKEKPSKNIGNVMKKVVAGDTIHVAQGTYLGRSKVGSLIIEVPVNIIGGYNDDFSKRDPWGAHKTILSGENAYGGNFKTTGRLVIKLDKWNRSKKMEFHRAKKIEKFSVLIDGIIVDNGARNRYKSDKELCIVRKASPKLAKGPTPSTAGISVTAPIHGQATVRNCVVMNCGPTQGALSVWGAQGSKQLIENNLCINNTGVGLYAHTSYHSRKKEGVTEFVIKNNTIVFTSKYDSYGGIGGHAFQLDGVTKIVATNNVFAFSDACGVYNPSKSSLKELTLAKNWVVGNLKGDMTEFDTLIDVDAWEDDTDELSDDSEDNIGDDLKLPVSKEFLKFHLSRVIIDRNKKEEGMSATKSKANEARKMLGLPLQAGALKVDSDVWLPRIKVDDALKAGLANYKGHGCSKPK